MTVLAHPLNTCSKTGFLNHAAAVLSSVVFGRWQHRSAGHADVRKLWSLLVNNNNDSNNIIIIVVVVVRASVWAACDLAWWVVVQC